MSSIAGLVARHQPMQAGRSERVQATQPQGAERTQESPADAPRVDIVETPRKLWKCSRTCPG